MADLTDWLRLWFSILHSCSCSGFWVEALQELLAEVNVMLQTEINEFQVFNCHVVVLFAEL